MAKRTRRYTVTATATTGEVVLEKVFHCRGKAMRYIDHNPPPEIEPTWKWNMKVEVVEVHANV